MDQLVLFNRRADQFSEASEVLFHHVTDCAGLCCHGSKLIFVGVGHDDDPRKWVVFSYLPGRR